VYFVIQRKSRLYIPRRIVVRETYRHNKFLIIIVSMVDIASMIGVVSIVDIANVVNIANIFSIASVVSIASCRVEYWILRFIIHKSKKRLIKQCKNFIGIFCKNKFKKQIYNYI